MLRTSFYKTPQFVLALVGVGLILLSLFALSIDRSEPSDNYVNSEPSQPLQVRPAVGTPSYTLDILQGTRTLQEQGGSNLQQPQTIDALQPNAETDTFSKPSLPE